MKKIWQDCWNNISNYFYTFKNAAKDIWEGTFKSLINLAVIILQSLKNLVSEFLVVLGRGLWTFLGGTIVEIGNALIASVVYFFDWIIGKITK